MSAEVYHDAMGYKRVVTRDRYNNQTTYDFRPATNGVGVEPYGDGNDYTPVVLQALWREGIPVDWSPEDLTPTERSQLKGFCDDCGEKIQSKQVGANEFVKLCPNHGRIE